MKPGQTRLFDGILKSLVNSEEPICDGKLLLRTIGSQEHIVYTSYVLKKSERLVFCLIWFFLKILQTNRNIRNYGKNLEIINTRL